MYATNHPPSVLIVADPDDAIHAAISEVLAARGAHVAVAADVDAAKAALGGASVALVISALAMNRSSELLSFLRSAARSARAIVVGAGISELERSAALRLGAVGVLQRPLGRRELEEAIALALDCVPGFHGRMHRLSLIDVLQMYHHSGQSLVLRVHAAVDGEIHLKDGELVHARVGAVSGAAALTALLAEQHGALETSVLRDSTRTLSGAFDHLLLDGLRALDEASRGAASAEAGGSDDWFTEQEEDELLDAAELVRWLGANAPGAGVWRIDPEGAAIERLDAPGDHPETEIAGTPGSIGWVYELAEVADPSWSRVTLCSGAIAVSLVRAHGITLAFARLVSGDAMKRRFQMETARLSSWLLGRMASTR